MACSWYDLAENLLSLYKTTNTRSLTHSPEIQGLCYIDAKLISEIKV